MNVPKLLKQAEKLISYGKVNEAINLYQDILSEDFHNTAVHNLIADLYISKQDIQRASRHARENIRSIPSRPIGRRKNNP